mmetsp:Transcript_13655/g.43123  ORF Transcript_13655/g.43123 Transcript_13655/m.43123 type:complete len:409 (+) Transcript_13655:47-1273(+)
MAGRRSALLAVLSCACVLEKLGVLGFQSALRVPVRRGRAACVHEAAVEVASSSTLLTSFADQGGNLAGKLFQWSLPPYVGFLYFLNRPQTGAPPLVRFGFGYLLLFVLATIPTGIISKTTWGVSLADCDWLHGGAESLLTVTNVLLVLGFRQALRGEEADSPPARYTALAAAVAVAALVATGVPLWHFEAHDAFLGGLGNLQTPLPEPANALSVPTWAVHFSSVAEFVVALGLACQYAEATNNPKWRGFAVAMLPAHASGICACVYHLFYNQPDMAWLVAAQAGLTLLGNTTLFLAALRLALANGWTLPFTDQPAEDDPDLDLAPAAPLAPSALQPASDLLLFAELAAFALVAAYATKYASLSALDFLQSKHDFLAAALVLASPLAVFAATGLDANDDDNPSEPAAST